MIKLTCRWIPSSWRE